MLAISVFGALTMSEYRRALTLLQEAAQLMDSAGDTLIAAHIALPIDILQRRLDQFRGTTPGAAT